MNNERRLSESTLSKRIGQPSLMAAYRGCAELLHLVIIFHGCTESPHLAAIFGGLHLAAAFDGLY